MSTTKHPDGGMAADDGGTAADAVASRFAEARRRWEERMLSPLAARSYPALRARPEQDCSLRTPFQRDRDRIVHCKAFRRLTHKTQVFVAPLGDHYRTRLTHTLEVTTISRTVARALSLNEDLVEAIGLGHDLGHAPFGHIGEEALDACLKERFGREFRHYEHSLRVVDHLEPAPAGSAAPTGSVPTASAVPTGSVPTGSAAPAGSVPTGSGSTARAGLNLTEQVRDGIVHHSSRAPLPETLEGRIVRVIDRVAYINHDIDDALRAGILRERDLPREPIAALGSTGSQRIDTLVHDMVEHSARAGDIVQGPQAEPAMAQLREFMFERVYLGPAVRDEHTRIVSVVRRLFEHYVEHPELLPDAIEPANEARGRSAGQAAEETGGQTAGGVAADAQVDLAQRVTDYVAGMTDRYCIRVYTELEVPHAFAR